ncbi:hypothetical protein MBANPS3_005247 [Mucor bainieri]
MALLTNRLFSDALRDMQQVMALFEPPSLLASPPVDMIETPDAYEVHAELPGYDKKDIKIEMPNSNTLVISGNVAKEYKSQGPSDESTATDEYTTADEDTTADATTGTATDKAPASKESQRMTTTAKDQDKQVGKHSAGHKWLVQERTSGSFVRTFTLPIAVKPETIKASYSNGILKVVVPKAENKQIDSQIVNID